MGGFTVTSILPLVLFMRMPIPPSTLEHDHEKKAVCKNTQKAEYEEHRENVKDCPPASA